MERSYRNGVDWRDLCEQASKEQDSEKLIEVVQRLNEALEERRRRPVQRPFREGRGGNLQTETEAEYPVVTPMSKLTARADRAMRPDFPW
jgi:hypothetical protein